MISSAQINGDTASTLNVFRPCCSCSVHVLVLGLARESTYLPGIHQKTMAGKIPAGRDVSSSWGRPSSRSRSPVAQPHRDRDRSRRERRRWPSPPHVEANRRPSTHGRAHGDAQGQPDPERNRCDRSTSPYTDLLYAHPAPLRNSSQRRVDDHRPDARREDSGHRERWPDVRSSYSPPRPSDSRVASHRYDDRSSGPWRDRHDAPSRPQGGLHTCRVEPRGYLRAHQDAAPPSVRGQSGHDDRPPVGMNTGGRPSSMHIELNKRIVAARDADSILGSCRQSMAHSTPSTWRLHATGLLRRAKPHRKVSERMITACKHFFRP